MRHFSRISKIPSLESFLRPPQISDSSLPKYYLQTYGCQMNKNDSEIIDSILQDSHLSPTSDPSEACLALLNTCSIRERAESKVIQRIRELQTIPDLKIGVLGCMAERLKDKLIDEKLADLVVGPDAYRSLPSLIKAVLIDNEQAINVQLSAEETYADISPTRYNSMLAYISIMRGCNNMCSFCVVPFTRGRERSRPISSILDEVKQLAESGVKEITLLGQNVNSYHDTSLDVQSAHANSPGFQELYKLRGETGVRFADLLSQVAETVPDVRIRFTSPHPKDFPRQVLECIQAYPNICKQVHLPLQSGSSAVLKRMRRLYTQEAFLQLANDIRETVPGVALSTDVIAGFCGETEEDHQETLKVLDAVQFEQAFTFAYSTRPRTHASNNMQDDVPSQVKSRRLKEIIDVVREGQIARNTQEIGRTIEVLVEGVPKKGPWTWTGRTSSNKRVLGNSPAQTGTLVTVGITSVSSQTLFADESNMLANQSVYH